MLWDIRYGVVRFEGFQNIFAWKMLAQVEHKKALPLSSSARVKYVIKNRSAHRGPIPANGELVGGSDIVEQMYQAGELEKLFNSVDPSD